MEGYWNLLGHLTKCLGRENESVMDCYSIYPRGVAVDVMATGISSKINGTSKSSDKFTTFVIWLAK